MTFLTLKQINSNSIYAPLGYINKKNFIDRIEYENNRDEINKLRKEYKNYIPQIKEYMDQNVVDVDTETFEEITGYDYFYDEFICTGDIKKCKSKRLNSLLKYSSDNDWWGSFSRGGKNKITKDDYPKIIKEMKDMLKKYQQMKQ